jgi:Alr-MurF fusion protein
MQQFSLQLFADYLELKASISASSNSFFNEIVFDSRRVFQPTQSLFIAIKSNKGDGHKYIKELAEKGVSNFVVENEIEIESLPNVNYILVDNAIKALQNIAAKHRKTIVSNVIGITGSNGKTIIKEWLYSVLHEDYNICRSPKSFNSQLGVPVSVLQITNENDLSIIEAGISQPGEMKNLAEVVQPDWGIFTNIGSAHAENFISIEQRIKEKLLLFENCSTLFYCIDHVLIHQEIENNPHFAKCKKITWGKSGEAQLRIISIETKNNKTLVKLNWDSSEYSVDLPFSDSASLENTLHVCLIMFHLGIEISTIQRRIEKLQAIEMRLEIKAAINGSILINDAYSADIESLKIALNSMDQQVKYKQKILFLSDFYQTGKTNEALYTEISFLLKQKDISLLVGVGEEISAFKHLFSPSAVFFKSTNDCVSNLSFFSIEQACILLKGARAFEFERIASFRPYCRT